LQNNQGEDGSIGYNLTENQEKCIELGCEQGTIYVGSKNSDKYYECTCHYANQILAENVVCFISKEDAEQEGRIWIEC